MRPILIDSEVTASPDSDEDSGQTDTSETKTRLFGKKVNDSIKGPDFDSSPLGQEIAKARAEEKRLKRERISDLRRKQRLKTLEQKKNAQDVEPKKQQRGKAKAAKKK